MRYKHKQTGIIATLEAKYISTNIPENYATPQEAYSAAFTYILNELI